MGNWLDKDHSLPAIKNWIWGQFQALKGGTEIASNTDLNTVSDIGNYYCKTNAIARTLTNIPIAATSMHAFTMKVGYGTGVGYVYQELIDYYTGIRYYRHASNENNTSAWSSWVTFARFGAGVSPAANKAVVTGSTEGEVIATDLAGAVEGSPTAIKRRGAFVAQSSNGGLSKPWYKVAEVTVTAKSQDREITFLVEDTMASAGNKYYMQGLNGILKVRCRTNENDSFGDSTVTSGGESTYLTWLSNSGYFDLDFALAIKVTAGTSVVYELWTKINFNYHGRRFIVLSEGYRTTKESEDWTLYNTRTNGSQASLPSGYEYIYSNISAQSAHRLVDEDLNNIKFANSTSYGVAYFYAAGSNTVVNSPFSSGSAFGLVLRKTAGNICVQEIWTTNGDQRYFRRWDGGSSSNNWTSWTKMPTSFASPAFTGTPTAPTPATSSNDTQIANTSFVKTVLDNAVNGIFIGENLYQPFVQSEGTNTTATAGTSATTVPLSTKKYDYDPNSSFDVLSDGGIQVGASGLFKITGAAMIKPNNNGNTTNLGVYLYVSKNGTETEEEVTLQSPGSSTLARVVTIGPKIISLESDDIIYLKSRCIGAAGTVDTTKSYLLIEQSFLHYEEVIPGTLGS